MINDRLKSALETSIEKEKEAAAPPPQTETPPPDDTKPKYETTPDELEAFYIIKALARENLDPSRLSHKDTLNYFSVLLDGNVRKWVCRLYLNGPKKYVSFQAEDKSEITHPIATIDDLFQHKTTLAATVTRLAGGQVAVKG